METKLLVPAAELAAFMNTGWPGEDWYLSDHAEYLWENTFTTGALGHLYEARTPGALIHLHDYDGRVRWQGSGRDPTGGRGYRLVDLFLRWRRTRQDALLVAYVPRDKLQTVAATLRDHGCLLVHETAPAAPGVTTPPELVTAT
jgi:hypothetical protein